MSASEAGDCTQVEPVDYYKEAVKLFYYNCILYNNLEKILLERNDLKARLLKFQILGNELAQLEDDEILNELEEKKKRAKRNGYEADKTFSCGQCKKAYSQENTLQMHIRLKHRSSTDVFLGCD